MFKKVREKFKKFTCKRKDMVSKFDKQLVVKLSIIRIT